MTPRNDRKRAIVLTAVTALWALLFFANGISEPDTVSGVVLIGGGLLIAAVLPLLAFIALIILARRLIRASGRSPEEKRKLEAMCFFLGPIGCLAVVFRLTPH